MNRTLVLLRHGQSQWNLDNRFTGWVDVDITARGREEAVRAGELMHEAGMEFDAVHSSVLKRAINTTWLALEAMQRCAVPVHLHWRLNERHYGALQGLDKAETLERHGEEQLNVWRRSYDIPPPPMALDDPHHPRHDPLYAKLDPRALPSTESLKTTLDRVLPYWHDVLAPAMQRGERLLVVAHGNTLRALYKYLLDVPSEEIVKLNVPTGIPLRMELDAQWRVVDHGYLGDSAAAERAAAEVAAQARRA
jgi:phosphoglycerate mutase (EC 5.4.2.1)